MAEKIAEKMIGKTVAKKLGKAGKPAAATARMEQS
jgi:hypothetical protein